MKRSVERLHRGVLLTSIAFLLALGPSSTRVDADVTDLFISEYIEGSSNNKAIEIYNGTGASIDLGANGYNVQMHFNGNPIAGLTINLTGSVASGDVFVLAHGSAVATILAQADQLNSGSWFNGNDAVVLRRGTSTVDVIGQVGFDPGAQWGSGLASTADNTLRRDPSVCDGDIVANDAFDPATGWTGLATDTFDGLGAHTADCSGAEEDAAPEVSSTFPLNGATDVPAGANLQVTFSEPVNVTATSFSLTCAPGGARALAVTPAGTNGFAIDPTPDLIPGENCSLRVAGMNVLNFFNTFGSACTTGVGGTATDCRGADNATEFERQWPRTVAAIVGTDAEIIGIIEIENDGYGAASAIQFLVDKLNDATDPRTYAFINADAATGQVNALGTDAIKVGVLYKPAYVLPVGTAALNSVAFVDGGDSGPRNRPSLAQAFEEIGTGTRFVVSVNHLKSKGSVCDTPDAGDGQGECNIVRTNAANELTQWLATDPTGSGDPDVLIIGDLNAYAKEDPVSAITSAGYTNMVPALGGDNAYSFVFDGLWGSLDHALANDILASQITGAEDWFINADEPSVLDYNTNFKSAEQLDSLYAVDEFRIADHNPVIVDLTLEVANDDSSFASAFGNLILATPAGLKAGDPGSKTYFTVGAKIGRWLRRPVGQISVVLRRTEADGIHLYHVGTWSITSLQTDRVTGKATIVATARVRDVTQPFRPVVLDTRATVRITLDDKGRPGALIDRVGITVWNRSNQLWFSSNWDGTTTVDQPITQGEVRVR